MTNGRALSVRVQRGESSSHKLESPSGMDRLLLKWFLKAQLDRDFPFFFCLNPVSKNACIYVDWKGHFN